MSLAAPITLAEARQAVLVRVGMGIQGNQSANAYPAVDEYLRSAVRQLYVDAEWTVLQMEATIALTTDQSEVDWPDDSEPGSIVTIVAVNTSGTEVPVEPGFRANERRMATTSGRPVVYYFHDGSIFLKPAASADWTSLIVNYKATSGNIEEDDDIIPVDAEAAIQHATLAFKRAWKLPVEPADEIRLQRYIEQIRANQSSGEGYVAGGRKRAVVERPNRVGRSRYYGNGAPYNTDWNPF